MNIQNNQYNQAIQSKSLFKLLLFLKISYIFSIRIVFEISFLKIQSHVFFNENKRLSLRKDEHFVDIGKRKIKGRVTGEHEVSEYDRDRKFCFFMLAKETKGASLKGLKAAEKPLSAQSMTDKSQSPKHGFPSLSTVETPPTGRFHITPYIVPS